MWRSHEMTRLFRLKWLHALSLLLVALIVLAVLPQTASGKVDSTRPLGSEAVSTISTDNYTYTSISGQLAPDSPFGPKRTSPDSGTPKHAYSPFDEVEEPLQKYEIVPGQVLVKLKPEVFSFSPQGQEAKADAKTVNQLFTK